MKTNYFFLMCVYLFIGLLSLSAQRTDGLSNYWKFDGQNLNDSVGENHCVSFDTISYVDGRLGSHGICFNRDINRSATPIAVDLNDSSLIKTTNKMTLGANAYTITFWFNVDRFSLDQTLLNGIFNRRSEGNDMWFVLGNYANFKKLIFQSWAKSNAVNPNVQTIATLQNARWYHAAAFIDCVNDTMALYLNGVFQQGRKFHKSLSGTPTTGSTKGTLIYDDTYKGANNPNYNNLTGGELLPNLNSTTSFGGQTVNTGGIYRGGSINNKFYGSIDDVRVYKDKVLTESEIISIYNETSSLIIGNPISGVTKVAKNKMYATVQNSNLKVYGANIGDNIEIYNSLGQNLKTVKVTNELTLINVAQKGLLLIKSNNQTIKVLM